MCVVQAELGQLGVSSGEKEGGEEGGENIPTSVWEEQLEQELNDLDLQVTPLPPVATDINPSLTAGPGGCGWG